MLEAALAVLLAALALAALALAALALALAALALALAVAPLAPLAPLALALPRCPEASTREGRNHGRPLQSEIAMAIVPSGWPFDGRDWLHLSPNASPRRSPTLLNDRWWPR